MGAPKPEGFRQLIITERRKKEHGMTASVAGAMRTMGRPVEYARWETIYHGRIDQDDPRFPKILDLLQQQKK